MDSLRAVTKRFYQRFLLQPRTGQTVLIRHTLHRSPLFQRKPPSYVEFAVPLVLLDLATTIGFAAFTWNHWTHDVDVVDEYLSTPKNPVIRKERQQVPWYFRVGLIAGQTTFGALIAARLLQVRFRYVRSLAFVPPRKQDLPRTKVGVHAASASNQVKLTSSGKTPALIFMQTASDPTALGQAWPIKNCVLEEIPNSDQLRIFIDGEVGSWFLDPSKGAFYDGKKDHRGALIKAGIVEAWVALKENRFSEPATLEKLEKKIQTATPLSQLKAQTK